MSKKEKIKIVTKKEVKVTVPKKIKEKKSVELVSFSVKATIPVMSFGNIMPEITVKAKNIEEAKEFVLPIIEKLFEKYVEAPRDGSQKPSFISKANVVVTEKIVNQPNSPTGASTVVPKTPEVKQESTNSEPITTFSAGYDKAVKAIQSAMSIDALDMIEKQIQDSIKLLSSEKPILLTILLKKKKELTNNK